MTPAIINRLKEGWIKNVVAFGTTDAPATPYIVVRMMSQPGVGRQVVIFVHMDPDQQVDLEDFVFNDLSVLLTDFRGVSRHGNHFKVSAVEEWQEIVTQNDDGSISMERRFLLPSLLF
jgi:hypothetical protein